MPILSEDARKQAAVEFECHTGEMDSEAEVDT